MSKSFWQVVFSKKMLICLFLGISSGLPLLSTGSTLQAWMKDEGVDLGTIGLFALVGLPYTLKFLWAPLIDWFVPLKLGRRRSWMLISQVTLIALFVIISFSNPSTSPWMVAFLALLICFAAATQDIVLDAHRRDILEDNELGLGTSLFVNGYRIGMILSGALALFLADHFAWQTVYQFIAAFMLVGVVTTFFAPEPKEVAISPSFAKAVIEPFAEFFTRKKAFAFLAFILLYKLGDSMATSLTTPFILSVGFTKTNLAVIAKGVGMAATIGGGLLGGLVIIKIGINKSLWIFGFCQAISTASFIALVYYPGDITTLTWVICAEYIASGLGVTAFTSFMASITDRRFSATQYAILSSLMGVPRVLISASSGFIVEAVGWQMFFTLCCLLAIPGLLLLFYVAPWRERS